MPTGKVKWFNKTKGFGFIAPDEGEKDIFVHISALEKSGLSDLADDQKVSFEISSCLLYTSPSPRDKRQSRMPSSA